MKKIRTGMNRGTETWEDFGEIGYAVGDILFLPVPAGSAVSVGTHDTNGVEI